MTPRPELLRDRQTFRDVLVMPITLAPGKMFVGGPIWPRYGLQIRARQSRGRFPIPLDGRPRELPEPVAHLESGTWCGPIVDHFGHGIADYGMRIAASVHADPSQKLVFGMQPIPRMKTPNYFWQMLDHYGCDRDRVVIVKEPTLVRELHVFPQAERRGGHGPSRRHLDFLDRVIARPDPAEIEGSAFISRSRLKSNRRFLAGVIAGEAYLEQVLAAIGIPTVYPEEMPLAEQLRLYQSKRRLVFSEGSALHGLQLLGRFDAEVVVIARRRSSRIAAESLRPRAASLRYVDAVAGTIHGLRKNGLPDRPRGIGVLDSQRLLRRLARVGLDLSSSWDEAAYRKQRDHDIETWKADILARQIHPGAADMIARCVKRLSSNLR